MHKPPQVDPTLPPADAEVPTRSATAPAPGAAIPTHYRSCFGCGSDHETGLHMVVTAGEGLTVSGVFTVTEHHQGAPGLAHGGLLSAAIDEVLGSLNWLIGVPAVTGRLACDFRKPVPVGSVLIVVAQIDAVHGRKVYTSATAYLGSADPQHIAITATALFVQVQIEHFLNNGNQTEVAAAVADRRSRWGDMAAAQTTNSPPELNPAVDFEVNP